MDVLNGDTVRPQVFGHSVGSGCSVVSAYGDQQFYIIVPEKIQVKPLPEILIRRFVTAHHQMRSAPVEYVVSQEEIYVDIGRFSVEKALIPLMQTDDPVSFRYEGLSYSSYNCIDAGSRSSSRQDYN